MLLNYFKIAWRNLLKHKGFSFINIAGLALGMACSLLILLWVQDELSIDQFHEHGAQLYQVMENQQWAGNDLSTTESTPGPLAEALKIEIPEVEKAVKVTWEEEHLLTVGDKAYKEEGRFASPAFFEMFTFPLLQGNSHTALAGGSSLVISDKVARKLFGKTDVVGRSVRVDNKEDRQVTGVIRDLPANSSIKFEFVMPLAPYEQQNKWLEQWSNNGIRTYVLLRPDASADRVSSKIYKMIARHDSATTNITLLLHPFPKHYLYSKFTAGKPNGGRIDYVKLFSLVGVFILIIACINFMNLATARSAKRAKEVGVRKVVGAERRYLMGQFVGEAVLTALLAMVLALLLVLLLFPLPLFNSVTGKQIALPYANLAFWLTLPVLVLITGLVAGSYPALFLSSLQPIKVLKGTLRFSAGAVMFRQGLVVFQFILSLLLIIGTLVVGQQVHYIKTKNLGVDRENLIYLSMEGELPTHFDAFEQELLQQPGIERVSASNANPLEVGSSTIGVDWKGKDPKAKILFTQMAVKYDFINTMKVNLLDGRDFSKDYATDSSNYLVNEEAARRMGMTHPVGEDLTFWQKKGKIVGLMKNFHLNNLRSAIEPLIIRLEQTPDNILVRTKPGQTEQALASLERVAKKYNPAYPFVYQFADDTFEKQYKSETLIGSLANCFAVLAIFIACLGLFGLAMFTAEQRTKEIGVRKVLGASVVGIVTLLSKDFLKLVLIAMLMATPVAWYAMYRWLQNFAYKINIEWWMFAMAGFLALGIALVTVSFQSIKAALMNPITSLRSE